MDDAEIATSINEQTSCNTKTKTSSDKRTFGRWCAEVNEVRTLEELCDNKIELNNVLSHNIFPLLIFNVNIYVASLNLIG